MKHLIYQAIVIRTAQGVPYAANFNQKNKIEINVKSTMTFINHHIKKRLNLRYLEEFHTIIFKSKRF